MPGVGLGLQDKTHSSVVPERFTVCGLPLALSEMLSKAVSGPMTQGINVTAIVQLALGAKEVPQVSPAATKSLALLPVIARLVMFKRASPVLLKVTVSVELAVAPGSSPKARLAGATEAVVGAAVVPVPERLTVCGLPLALSLMLSEASQLPLAKGLNVILMVQLRPAGSKLPQVLPCSAKSLALAPVIAML